MCIKRNTTSYTSTAAITTSHKFDAFIKNFSTSAWAKTNENHWKLIFRCKFIPTKFKVGLIWFPLFLTIKTLCFSHFQEAFCCVIKLISVNERLSIGMHRASKKCPTKSPEQIFFQLIPHVGIDLHICAVTHIVLSHRFIPVKSVSCNTSAFWKKAAITIWSFQLRWQKTSHQCATISWRPFG